jgi:hypothetical protein
MKSIRNVDNANPGVCLIKLFTAVITSFAALRYSVCHVLLLKYLLNAYTLPP